MNLRRLPIFITAFILVISLFAGVVQALDSGTTETAATENSTENIGSAAPSVALRNVRDYAAAPDAFGTNYAIDGGALFAGGPDLWQYVETPEGVIVNTVAVDSAASEALYIGAANELAIYRATMVDGETEWLRIPLNEQLAGGITDIAIDGAQRILYVGTDTDGLYRLRDVGSSVTLSGHLILDEPVEEIVTDSTGAALAFARTPWTLYRAQDFGLAWSEVTDIHSVPTALAMSEAADGTPVALVGTVDRGVLRSSDGLTWSTANEGLGQTPGTRLYVEALTVDPAQPEIVYAATSYILGSTTLRNTPSNVVMGDAGGNGGNGALAWTTLETDLPANVAALLPVSGETGAVYALTNESRTPLALGNAPAVPANVALAQAPAVSAEAADVVAQPGAPVAAAQTGFNLSALSLSALSLSAINWGELASWFVAGLAALALGFALVTDVRRRGTAQQTAESDALDAPALAAAMVDSKR